MNNIFLILLSLSVSGSILLMIFWAIRPFIKNRFSYTWQYYIWIIVILRFLLPVTADANFLGYAAQYIERGITATDQTSEQNVPKPKPETMTDGETWLKTPQPKADATTTRQNAAKAVQDNIWLIWASGMLMMFFYKVISYNAFVRFVTIRAQTVTDPVALDIYRAELASAKIRRKIPLKINDRLGSPMLAGILQPILLIPSLDVNPNNLRYIFRHELTHYKHGDVLYKWLVQINKCVHWFNPLVYLIGKQIDQSCELSCDEAIIKRLDDAAQEDYGDALISSLKSQENYSAFVISMTMSDNKKRLKERLDAIMNYKKIPRLTAAISIALACSLCFGATALGAYSTNPAQSNYMAAPPTIPRYNESLQYGINQEISISAYNIIEYSKENQKVNIFIEFLNNTPENIDLLYFNYEAFNSEGSKILTSQDNTNNFGETLVAGKTIRIYLTLPESLSTMNISITKYQTQDGKLKSIPKDSDNSYRLDFTSAPSLGNATDIKLENYEFFTIEETPAIKATFQNNTNLDISAVNVRINFLDFKNSYHNYTAKIDIKAGESATHSGWGLVNGVKNIELGIISYLTADGTTHEINTDEIEWLQLPLK